MTDLRKLRQDIRQRRRKLDDATRMLLSREICQTISGHEAWRTAKKIATFLSFDGEVNSMKLVYEALDTGKQLFLPVLPEKGQPLSFAWFDRQSKMVENRFGIREPEVLPESLLDPQELDLVIVPLVAFDESCNRIGVGGGFYDRTFAFRKTSEVSKPLLIGVAFELQKVDHVEVQSWDVQLDAVVTEKNVYRS